MAAASERNGQEITIIDQNEIEYKIEIATQTLDRNIGFVTNCDNKTSIILTAVGVLLTIILTNEGLNQILQILKSCIGLKNFCSILYLICFACAIFIMVFGMFNLGSVLVANTSEEAIGRKNANSRIFFGGIKESGNHTDYKQRFYTMSREELLNDLIEQIYVNADIATTKYAKYNRGLKLTILGFALFVTFLFIGIYLY